MKNALLEILDSARLLDNADYPGVKEKHDQILKDISANAYRKRKDGD